MKKRKNIKTALRGCAILLLLLALTLPASAAGVTVQLDGAAMAAPAALKGGTTYVPLRAFCDEVGGCAVRWDGAARQATVTGAVALTAPVGGGNYIEDGVLWVPVRALAAALGRDVSWDPVGRTALVGDDSLYWLARIIEAEAGGEPWDGKVAVGNVVLNRVGSDQFPDTVHDVVFDRSYGVQFTPVANGRVYNTPSAESTAAAKACLSGQRTAGGSLYFFNPDTSTAQGWIVRNRVYFRRIGSHVFYL